MIGPFCAKYTTFDLKKYWGVIFHDTEELCKIWRKTDLWFGKWHGKFGKFSPEHKKFSKLGLSLNPFIQSRKCMSLKLTVMRYDNEEWCKMWTRIDVPFQNWQKNLASFDPNTQKSKKFAL